MEDSRLDRRCFLGHDAFLRRGFPRHAAYGWSVSR